MDRRMAVDRSCAGDAVGIDRDGLCNADVGLSRYVAHRGVARWAQPVLVDIEILGRTPGAYPFWDFCGRGCSAVGAMGGCLATIAPG